MKKKNNQRQVLFQTLLMRNAKFRLKNSFLWSYFSNQIFHNQSSLLLPTFNEIKPQILHKENLFRLNLKKNKSFFTHSKKNCFFISDSKQNEQMISKIFLNSYIKALNCKFNAKKTNLLKKMNFNSSHPQIQEKIFQKQHIEYLKQHFSSFYRSLNMHKIDFLNQNFLWLFSIVFQNKQIHRFIYFYLSSKRAEIYYFYRFLRFFFNFSFLNIFLFNLLYNCAQKQHLNNSNTWILKKYWLFLQPSLYFFKNDLNVLHSKVMVKKISFQIVNNSYFFMCKKSLFNLNITRNFSPPYSKNSSEISLNSYVKNSVKDPIFYQKNLTLKTYYLDQYKTSYVFKLNIQKNEKKYSCYLTSIQPKLRSLESNFNHTFQKHIANETHNLMMTHYAFIKLWIIKKKFN